MDSRSASSEKRQRIDLLDLKEQREGEAHIFFKSKIVRARMFFANPPPVERMRINQFLKVEPPIGRILIDLETHMERFQELMDSPTEELFALPTDEGEEIQIISDSIASQPEVNAIERSLAALLAFHNRHTMTEEEAEPEEEFAEGRINIFSKVKLDDSVKAIVGAAKIEQFSQPLVNKNVAKDKVELIERLLGRSASQAGPMTSEIIKDIALATDYPPDIEGIFLPTEEVVAIANEVCDYVASLQTKSQGEDS